MRIIIDTREQSPLDFSRWPDVTVETGTLTSGDYSLAGLTDRFGVERKSLPDLVASVTKGRDRFQRELERLRGFDVAALVVEGIMEQVARHEYRSKSNPDSVLQSLAAFQVRYGVPVIVVRKRQRVRVSGSCAGTALSPASRSDGSDDTEKPSGHGGDRSCPRKLLIQIKSRNLISSSRESRAIPVARPLVLAIGQLRLPRTFSTAKPKP